MIDAQNTIQFNQNQPISLPNESDLGLRDSSGENMTPAYMDFVDNGSENGDIQPRYSNAYNGYGERTPFADEEFALGNSRRLQAAQQAEAAVPLPTPDRTPKYANRDLTGVAGQSPDPLNFAALTQSPQFQDALSNVAQRLGPKGLTALRGVSVINMVNEDPHILGTFDPNTRQVLAGADFRGTIAHELAHAYEDEILTPRQKADFYNTLYDLASNGDPVARQALITNPNDPQHAFTFIALRGYTGQPIPDALKPFVAGLFNDKVPPPRSNARVTATEPPPPADLGIRSPGPNTTPASLEQQQRTLRAAEQIAGHFGAINNEGVKRGAMLNEEARFAGNLPQPTAPTYLNDKQRQQLLAAQPYIQSQIAKGVDPQTVIRDVLGSTNLGDPITAGFTGLATQVGKLPAISAPLSGGFGQGGVGGGGGGVTSQAQVKDTDPVSQMIYQSIPAIIAGEVLPAGIAERLFTAVGGIQGTQLAQDYQSGKISGTQAAIGLAQIAPQLAGIIAKAGGLGKGLGESGMLASERGSLGTPPEPGRSLEPTTSAPTTADEAALHVSEWLRKGEKARPEQQRMFDEQRSAQLQRMESVFQQNGPNAAAEAKAAGAGGFERPALAPLELAPQHEAAIRSEINTSPMYDHAGQRIQASDALDAMQRGHLPQPAHAVELSKILGGPQFLDAFLKAAPVNWSSEVLGALGIPQALQSSLDASAVLRQMAPLGWSNPKSYFDALGTIGRAFGSDEGALSVQRETEALPWVSSAPVPGAEGLTYSALGGRMADIGAHLQESEGQFSAINRSLASRAVEKLPWVKPSERIYNAPINRLRGDVYSRFAQNMWDAGVRDPKAYRAVVHVIEHATGWGTVEIGQIGRGLNAFYSPRNLAARFQVLLDPILQPGSLLKPSARQLAAKNLVGFVGANAALLGMMAGSGALAGHMLGIPNPVHVELDPRSTDVWKGRIGNLRIDMTGGYGSILRLVARLSPLLKGSAPQVKDINGVVSDASPARLLDTFLRGKMGPIPGVIYDALGFPGGEGYAADLRSKEGWRTEAFNMLTPFFVQDVVNAWREQGAGAAAIAAPVSFFGGSVNTYSQSDTQKQAQKLEGFTSKLKGARIDRGEVYPTVLDSDFKSPAWRNEFKKDSPELGDLSKYDNLTALRKAYVDYWAPKSKLSRDEISAAFDKQAATKLWEKNVQQEKLNWWKQNATLVDEARTNNALPSSTILKAIGK